jgi:exodeoxyribonuclease V beta subunit
MNLDLSTQNLVDGLAVEASAGTGKTYSITGLLTRDLVADEQLSIGQVLVTTFTRNAAAELRDRIRRMLVQAESSLRSAEVPDDPFLVGLRAVADPADGAARLQRAIAAFDTANIMTIHQFCSIVLRSASQQIEVGSEEEPIRRTIARAVNDAQVLLMGREEGRDSARGFLQRNLDADALADVLETVLSHPKAVQVLATGVGDLDPEARRAVANELRMVVDDVLTRVRRVLAAKPSYDELIRRAHEVLCGGKHESVREALASRFRWVLVDEAQDTDAQQWEILGALFRSAGSDAGRGLISIGDPKQAIYGFRGADVNAYLRQVGQTPDDLRRTLTTNFRSDEHLVGALNVMLDGARFGGVINGPSIGFEEVRANRGGSVVSGVAPMVVVELSGATGQTRLYEPVAAQVLHLLDGSVTLTESGDAPRPVRPGDITVLARTGAVAQQVQRDLLRLGVPAVSNSTESVAKGETFGAIRCLARALARPSHDGLVRVLTASPIVGRSMLDPILRDESFLAGMQDLLDTWRTVLEVDGITAMAAAVLGADVPTTTTPVSSVFLGTDDGLRRVTDFAHVIEYVHAATRGRGIQPAELLARLDDLSELDEKAEAAARRVETDEEAVQTMTIHSAKGLEFPIVIVADLWKSWITQNDGRGATVVEWEGGHDIEAGRKVVDLGHAIGGTVESSTDDESGLVGEIDRLRRTATFDERSRLFYVAATRAKHHLTVMVPTAAEGKPFSLNDKPVAVRDGDRGCLNLSRIPSTDGMAVIEPPRPLPARPSMPHRTAPPSLEVAAATRVASIVHPRTSFTAITNAMSQPGAVVPDELPRVDDEQVGQSAEASVDPAGSLDLPLWPLPAGRLFGIALHSILEHVSEDESIPLADRVGESVRRHASPSLLARHEQALVEGLVQVLETPLGTSWDEIRLCDLRPSQRVNEMRFHAGLTELSVPLSGLGEHLASVLAADDPLRPYAVELASVAPQVDFRGVLNGSVDTMLWLPVRGEDRLVICDYKSNRISQPDDLAPIDRYSPVRLRDEMAHHHYPLQALLYGVAAFRYLRWRTGDTARADRMVGGYAYLFVRGMIGAATPAGDHGRHGVASWSSDPYPGLWHGLSDLLGGVRR